MGAFTGICQSGNLSVLLSLLSLLCSLEQSVQLHFDLESPFSNLCDRDTCADLLSFILSLNGQQIISLEQVGQWRGGACAELGREIKKCLFFTCFTILWKMNLHTQFGLKLIQSSTFKVCVQSPWSVWSCRVGKELSPCLFSH